MQNCFTFQFVNITAVVQSYSLGHVNVAQETDVSGESANFPSLDS